MTKRKVCKRYRPEGKNIFDNKYSGFRKGISFGTKTKAKQFIKKIRKQGMYKQFRIKTIRC